MPILPFGLGRELIQRVRQRLTDNFGPGAGPSGPTGPGGPAGPAPDEVGGDRNDFIVRVVQRLTRNKGESQGRERRPPPSGVADVMARIQEAGRRKVLLSAHYAAAHGHGPSWRYLGAYSYRYRDKADPGIPLLYAWCGIHHAPGARDVEAFKPKRFLDLQVTNLPFSPAWPVEF